MGRLALFLSPNFPISQTQTLDVWNLQSSSSVSSDSAISGRKRKAKRAPSEPKPTRAKYYTRSAARAAKQQLAEQERIAFEQTRGRVIIWDLPEGRFTETVKAFRLEYSVVMKKHCKYEIGYPSRELTYDESVKLAGKKLLGEALGTSCDGWPYDVRVEGSNAVLCYLSEEEVKRVRGHKDVVDVDLPACFFIW